jgi:hypothetical protein
MKTRLSVVVISAAVPVFVACALPVSAQQASVRIPKAELLLARASQGVIRGVVLDTGGQPLAGAMVSALGSTVAFALTGRDGRFTLDALPMGAYNVRVHLDGYAPSRRQVIEVRGGSPSMLSVALQSLAAPASPTGVRTASFAPFDAAPRKASAADGDAEDGGHTETAWRLRHLKRSVLKSVEAPTTLAGEVEPVADDDGRRFGNVFESSIRFAGSPLADHALTGQVNLFTTGSLDGVSDLASSDAFAAASVTYVALGAPVGGWGAWTVRGAMRQGEVASWFLNGTFSGRVAGAHRFSGGLAYGTQHLDARNLLGHAAIVSGSRAIGAVHVADDWKLGSRVTVNYGVGYAWQDYVREEGLWSPRVSFTLTGDNGMRLRTVVARIAMAPGAEELLPSGGGVDGAWLPAQRSFSAWTDVSGFRPQRTDHVELAIEREARHFLVGFRSFYEHTDDQLGSIFAAPTLAHPAASLGHYYVATVGDVTARGWGVSVSRAIIAGVRGSVDYSQTAARWATLGDGVVPWYGTTSLERFHDLTTSLETQIPQTATRVYVLYRINTAFARQASPDEEPGLASRFDVQVNQALPFMGFTSADWEVLVAVRNLFRDQVGERSLFDELLVVRPPTRIVGGVRVRF